MVCGTVAIVKSCAHPFSFSFRPLSLRRMDFPADRAGGPPGGVPTAVELASEAELEGYGRAISLELDKAEAELNAPRSRPFGGLGAGVMADVQRLRTEQFDMFRRHVQIEQQYRVASPIAEPHVRSMSFSAIADTMREKESATASLLNRLADFDNDLRQVIANVENSPSKKDPEKRSSDDPAVRSADGLPRTGSLRRRSGGAGPS